MSDTEHAFDPHWKFGHDLLFPGDYRVAARILSTDGTSATHKIVAEYESALGWKINRFTLNGVMEGYRGTKCARLINRPASEPVVVEMRRHINDYFFRGARTPDGLPPHVRIETTATLFSDGSVRASAEVVK